MDLAKYIDHTFLKPDGSPNDIARLCREAKRYGFASVCVHPAEVARCRRLLKGSGVKVCTVIGFPLGAGDIRAKIAEAFFAIEDGADELDLVVNLKALKYDPKQLGMELLLFNMEVRDARADIVTKLIIECCYLTDAEKVTACEAAKAAGFDFVKTSTGFGPGGATVEDVRLMRKAVGRKMGVKAAGGIRTREAALAMIKAGATRIGTSNGVAIVTEKLK